MRKYLWYFDGFHISLELEILKTDFCFVFYNSNPKLTLDLVGRVSGLDALLEIVFIYIV